MQKMSPYNHADEKAVATAITNRLVDLPNNLKATQFLLGEVVMALLEINAAIPAQMKYRYLIAAPLEVIADGAAESDPHKKSGG